MKAIKIKFVGFDKRLSLVDWLVYRLISKGYEINPNGKPDYVVFCNDGQCEFRYNDCIKILIQSENRVCDFNAYDYAVGFDYMTFGDRYLRNPQFSRRAAFSQVINRVAMSEDELLNRKFCSFVVSNVRFGDPMREKFFRRLSQYKRVDSGGRFLNNVGGPVKDKLAFCREYKFNIAFENSSSPGYTTEKIMEAYAARSVPIYYGNPNVETDFRTESMVRVMGADDIERAVDEVVRLDNDDDAYIKTVTAQCLSAEDPGVYERELGEFLAHIFEQPIEQARRRNKYGCQAMMAAAMKRTLTVDDAIRNSCVWKLGIKAHAAIRKFSGRLCNTNHRG